MDSSLLMVIQSYFGIFLLLLLTFTFNFIENIIKNYDVLEIFKTIFRISYFRFRIACYTNRFYCSRICRRRDIFYY